MSVYPKKHPTLSRPKLKPSCNQKGNAHPPLNPKSQQNVNGAWGNASKKCNNKTSMGPAPSRYQTNGLNTKQRNCPNKFNSDKFCPCIQYHPPIETANGTIQYCHKIYEMKRDPPSMSFRQSSKRSILEAMRPPIVIPEGYEDEFFPRPQSPITIDDSLKILRLKPEPPKIKQLIVRRGLVQDISETVGRIGKHTFAELDDASAKQAELDKMDNGERTRFTIDLCGYDDKQISMFVQGRNLIVEASKPVEEDGSLVTTRETIELPEGVAADNFRVGRDKKGFLFFEEAWKF